MGVAGGGRWPGVVCGAEGGAMGGHGERVETVWRSLT